MRAVWVRKFGPQAETAVEDVAEPKPSVGEILIEVHAASVNYPDLLVMAGAYQVRPPLPFAPGKDLAGTVVAVGEGVVGFSVGERVMALVEYGAYAQYAVAPAAMCFHLPDSLSMAAAAAMGLTYQTAHFALFERGALKAGEAVLVTGAAGGVGLAAVQLAKAHDARVLAGVRQVRQHGLVQAHGADYVVDLAAPDLRDELRKQVRDRTGGRLDVVVDTIGGDIFDAALRALDWCGRMVVVGFAGGRIPQVKANYLLVKNIALLGLQWSDYRERAMQRVHAVQQHLFELYANGWVRPEIWREFPLEDVHQALNAVEHGQVDGKVLLRMRPSTLGAS